MSKNTFFLRHGMAFAFGVAVVTASGAAWAGAGHGASSGSSIGMPGHMGDVSRTVTVTMGDNYYEPANLEVKEGETVKFIIKNAGDFMHEFNIGTPNMHAAHQKEMANMAEHGLLTPTGVKTDMGHMDHSKMGGNMPNMKHDDPNSILLKPGETREMVWKFGSNKGLEFACNVPGHYESGMVGKIKLDH